MLVAPILIVAAAVAVAPAEPAAAARDGFAAQRAAWNAGDIEGALTVYWDDPGMTWVNRRGIERGFRGFADAMRADFAGKPAAMGVYSGEVLDARTLAPDVALIVARWAIERDGKRMMGGVSTQLWRRIGARWRIVLEHAS